MLNLSLSLRNSFHPSEWTFANKKNTCEIFFKEEEIFLQICKVSLKIKIKIKIDE